MIRVQIPLKVIDTQFVRIFKFTVVFVINLNCIVGQMDIPIEIFEVKWFRRGA